MTSRVWNEGDPEPSDRPAVVDDDGVTCQHPHPDQPRTRTWCELAPGHDGEHRSGYWSWATQGIPWPDDSAVVLNRWSPDYFPETAPETTDPLIALVQKWRRQAVDQRPRDDEADASLWTAALDGAADDLRAVMDAFGDPVESTEYRVTVDRPEGGPMTFDARDFQAQFWLNNGGTDGYPPALVECRTVTTVTSRSGWRPVDTGGDQ